MPGRVNKAFGFAGELFEACCPALDSGDHLNSLFHRHFEGEEPRLGGPNEIAYP